MRATQAHEDPREPGAGGHGTLGLQGLQSTQALAQAQDGDKGDSRMRWNGLAGPRETGRLPAGAGLSETREELSRENGVV